MKEFWRRNRVQNADNAMKPAAIRQMVNNILFKDPSIRTLWFGGGRLKAELVPFLQVV